MCCFSWNCSCDLELAGLGQASGLWGIVSKDTLGSRKAAEAKFSELYLRRGSSAAACAGGAGSKKVVIDMCNVAVEDRAGWLDLVFFFEKTLFD
jgi:hypothetical protein